MEKNYKDLLPTYDYNPSGFDSRSNYIGENCSNYYNIYSQNRDSDVLTRCNFTCIFQDLEELEKTLPSDSDEPFVDIHRHGHWACGWIEYIFVRKDSPEKLLDHCVEILSALDSYPVFNEDKLSEAEYEEANEVWKNCYDSKERIEYVRKYRDQFTFHNFSDLMSCIRGEYFAGYASELIY